jgi:hypothetical protein
MTNKQSCWEDRHSVPEFSPPILIRRLHGHRLFVVLNL